LGWIEAIGGPHEQMEMFRHQDIAEEPESKLGAQLCPRGDEFALEELRVENLRAAIGAGGQKVKIVFTVVSGRV
jgi:hypothetical protein